MSDLISRQDAIEWLTTQWDGMVTSVFDGIKRLPSAERKGEWIPCSERLPEDNGVYIVTTSIGQCQIHVFNKDGNSREYWTRCNKAWMPMPEPYQGGER